MRMQKLLLTTMLMLSAFAVPAMADDMMMKPGTMMMVGPDGKMSSMTMSDPSMSKKMMDGGTMMKEPQMLMMGSDGKMYMMKDAKMSNGKMMSEDMMMNSGMMSK